MTVWTLGGHTRSPVVPPSGSQRRSPTPTARWWQPGRGRTAVVTRHTRRLLSATDVMLALVVALLSIGALVVSDETGTRSADTLGALLLAAMAAPLAVRRRWPSSMVVPVCLTALVSFILGYPGGPPTLALLVALYSVAAAGHRWWTLAITVVFAGGGLIFRAAVEADAPVSIAMNSALFILVSLLGDAVHSRQQLALETRERLRLAEIERDTESRRRVTRERLRIARDLHDVLAHSVTTMSVQVGAALDALEDRPEQARQLLGSVRATSRQTMQEVRAAVTLLRDGGDNDEWRAPAPDLGQLPDLIARVSAAGLDAELTTCGRAVPLPPAVGLTGYRIVQEALTNAIRHAAATCARVEMSYLPGRLIIQVDDDGRGPATGLGPGAAADGSGLRGMRERVEALRGTFAHGPAPAGGFRVRAIIPTGEEGGP